MNSRQEADPGPVAIDATGAVLVTVRVIPRARETRVDGVRNHAVLVRLAAPPVDGAANIALLEFLSRLLRCPRRQLQVVSGEKSRNKSIRVDGLTLQIVEQRLFAAS